MKYWRGYLIAAITAACAWGLSEFAKAHTVLVDMVYPYVTRMIQTFLADWSAGVDFCVWQVVLMALGVGLLVSIVLMIIFKWNPIQWFGWVLTAVSVIFLLHTGIYGLNQYAGPLADDIRLQDTDYKYTVTELEEAAIFYRDKANALAEQISRDGEGNAQLGTFRDLAVKAADGFKALTYGDFNAVFAGSTVPVKELTGASKGTMGKTVALTGEAAVNPNIPAVCLPYAMCREMARRMCIAIDRDAELAAFLTCAANPAAEFQYSAYFMAYRYCLNGLKTIESSIGQSAVQRAEAGANARLQHDLAAYDDYFGEEKVDETDGEVCDLLVIWHIQKYVLPSLVEDEETRFDPTDENAVDLSGIVNAKTGE